MNQSLKLMLTGIVPFFVVQAMTIPITVKQPWVADVFGGPIAFLILSTLAMTLFMAAMTFGLPIFIRRRREKREHRKI